MLEKHFFLEIISFAPSFHFLKSYLQWKLETLLFFENTETFNQKKDNEEKEK